MGSGPPGTPALIEIAVLDDDPDFLACIEDLLRGEARYAVRTYAHTAALLAGCEERTPAIVLLDMKMGDASGAEVLARLQTRYPGLCVIIVTGYPSMEEMRATFQMKAFDYLAKPFSLAQLRQTLGRAAETFGLGRTDQDRLRERLGQRIKVLRAERGWSLKDLAQSTHISISQISSIERGAHLPSIESFLALCRAFGRKPSEILGSIDF